VVSQHHLYLMKEVPLSGASAVAGELLGRLSSRVWQAVSQQVSALYELVGLFSDHEI